MDATNPYQSPQSSVRASAQPEPGEIPEDIRKDIRNGLIAAVVTCTLTVCVTVFQMFRFGHEDPEAAWNLVDVGLVALLAIGIWRNSRVAATTMLVYFVLSKILQLVETGQPAGLVLSFVFIYFYYKAMMATYRYHRFVKQWRQAPPAETGQSTVTEETATPA